MEEKTLLTATIIFPVRGDKVLLPRKMRKIGAGRRNGFGGGIEEGESLKEAASRELWEESGGKNGDAGLHASPGNFERVAVVDFHNKKSDGSAFTCRCHIMIVREWEGEFSPTDEMVDPQWFDIYDLPLDELLPADRFWIPPVMEGKRIYAEAWYGPFQSKLLKPVEIREVEHFRGL